MWSRYGTSGYRCRGPLVIELDQNHRTVDAVVVHGVGFGAAHPREVRFVQARVHFIDAHARVLVAHVVHVQTDQLQELALLTGIERAHRHACVVEDDVVLECFREIVVDCLRGPQRRCGTLLLRERLQERQAGVLFILHYDGALVLAGVGARRLGAEERRRHDDLIAEHEIVDDEMMAVELPAPRLGRRRRAHHCDPVQPLVVLDEVVVVELAERAIQLHDVAAQLQPLRAQRGAHQPEGGFALCFAHLVEADALAHVEADVHPLAPFDVIDGVLSLAPLLVAERRQEFLGGDAHGLGGDAGGAHGEQAAHRLAVGCDALERLGETAFFGGARHRGEPGDAIGLRQDGPGERQADGQQNELAGSRHGMYPWLRNEPRHNIGP
jgi:hypothetical protein